MDARTPALVPALRRRAQRCGTTLPDVLLAAGLLPLSLLDVNAETTRWPAPTLLVAGVAVAALAWRQRHPLAVALALCLLHAVLTATTPGPWPPQLLLFAVLLGVYTAGAQTTGRRSLVVGTGTLLLLYGAHVVTPDGDPGDFLPLVLWGAPWLAGRLVRRQTLEAAAAGTRAAEVLRRREEELREARVRERDRIARELHDVVAHAVALMVVQAGAERLRLGTQAAQTREVLRGVETAGRQALTDLRSMLGVLRSGTDPDGDLAARAPQPRWQDLPALVGRVRQAGLPVVLDQTGDGEVPAAVGLSAYRIVQEALTNVLKHAGPVPTTVHLEADGQSVCVAVTSALPPGVPAQRSPDGRGLRGMHERAVLHGGDVVCGPQDGAWSVRAVLPTGAP